MEKPACVLDSCNLIGNGSFEQPQIIGPNNRFFFPDEVSCWETTPLQDGIEIWTSAYGFNGGEGPSAAFNGGQYCEVNCFYSEPLFQTFTVLSGGGTGLTLSFAHAGRSGSHCNVGSEGALVNQMIVKVVSGTGITGAVEYTSSVFNANFPTKLWRFHTINLPYLAPGLHTLIFEPLGGYACGNFLDAVSITPPPPSVNATSNSPVNTGVTLNLYASTTVGATYSWTGPNGFTSLIQNPFILYPNETMSGTYTVTMIDSYGCVATSSIYITVQSAEFLYIIRDCNPNGQSDFITADDYSAQVGLVIKTCINSNPKAPIKNFSPCWRFTSCCNPNATIIVNAPPSNVILSSTSSIIFGEINSIICWTNGTIVPCPDTSPLPLNYYNITWSSGSYQIYNSVTECTANNPCHIPNFYYKFTKCCDPSIVYIIGTPTQLPYVNLSVTLSSSPSILRDSCWFVQYFDHNHPTTDAVINPSINIATIVNCTDEYCINACNPTWPDGCYCVEILRCGEDTGTACTDPRPWPGVFHGIFNTCPECNCKSYILHDCAKIEPDQHVTNDFLQYVGMVIKIDDCDTCWSVTEAGDCNGAVCCGDVSYHYTTCESCLPQILPIPKEHLHPRRVKPGYYTPGCSPEYTEKVNCKFAEAAYDVMVAKRYGLQMCCAEDLQEWTIKKQELDLRAIYDPSLCVSTIIKCCPPTCVEAIIILDIAKPCPPPVNVSAEINTLCVEYQLIGSAFGDRISYINCCGDLVINRVIHDHTIVCSTAFPTTNGRGTISPVEPIVICSTPTCYQFELNSNTGSDFQYSDCDGIFHNVHPLPGTTLYVCGFSARLITGDGFIVKNCIQCQPCKCYKIHVLILNRIGCGFSILNCGTGREGKVLAYFGDNYFCSPIKPYNSLCIEGVDYIITEEVPCSEADSPCFIS